MRTSTKASRYFTLYTLALEDHRYIRAFIYKQIYKHLRRKQLRER